MIISASWPHLHPMEGACCMFQYDASVKLAPVAAMLWHRDAGKQMTGSDNVNFRGVSTHIRTWFLHS